jgi:hypothetical protein
LAEIDISFNCVIIATVDIPMLDGFCIIVVIASSVAKEPNGTQILAMSGRRCL